MTKTDSTDPTAQEAPVSEQTTKRTGKVGETVEVKEGAIVERPQTGGYQSVVTGGSYVFDVPGTYVVDGSEVTVK